MKYEDIEKYGVTARGKQELLKYLNGEQLTRKEAMLSKCFECMGGYADGRVDCGVESCPLYSYMPFNPNPVAKRVVSNGQREAFRDRMKKSRAKKAVGG